MELLVESRILPRSKVEALMIEAEELLKIMVASIRTAKRTRP